MDVSEFAPPGKNIIAVRIWNDSDIGGIFNRSFLWSPKKIETEAAATEWRKTLKRELAGAPNGMR